MDITKYCEIPSSDYQEFVVGYVKEALQEPKIHKIYNSIIVYLVTVLTLFISTWTVVSDGTGTTPDGNEFEILST